MLLVVEARSLNHWTTREVPDEYCLKYKNVPNVSWDISILKYCLLLIKDADETGHPSVHQKECTPLIPYPGEKWKTRDVWSPFQACGRFGSLQLSHLSKVL